MIDEFNRDMAENNMYTEAEVIDDNGILKIRMKMMPLNDYIVRGDEGLVDAAFFDIMLANENSQINKNTPGSVTQMSRNYYTNDLTDSLTDMASAQLRRAKNIVKNDFKDNNGKIMTNQEISDSIRRTGRYATNYGTKGSNNS
mgnify:CR=1 FL=1